jgi:hypothetical protein
MNEFETILQESLLALELGDSTLDECLSRHPRYASQLEPILLTTLDLDRGREARPSAAFKTRVRAKVTQEIRAHPRRSMRFDFMFMRMAMSFVVIALALLVTGTAYAQSALPGQTFYDWKLASENIWRAVSPDPVGTDLAIAGRRANELIAIGNNPEQRTQILEAYREVMTRLELEMDAGNEARIRSALEAQMEELNNIGITLPPPEQTPLPTPTPENPTETPQPTSIIPEVNPTLPLPTILPKIDPTIEIPPLIQ